MKTSNTKPDKITIVVDWLQFVICPQFAIPIPDTEMPVELKVNKTLTFHYLGSGTKLFKYRYDVYFKRQLIGHLQAYPRNIKLIEPDSCHFRVANHLFYQKGWLNIIKEFFEFIGAEVLSTTRVDIALDNAKNAYKKLCAWDNVTSKIIQKSSKGGGLCIHIDKNPDKSIKLIHLGSLKSDKTAKIYTKEPLTEKHHKKRYIYRFWQENGLKVKSCKRFELTIKSKIFNDSYDWQKLDDIKYLADIFKTELEGWLELKNIGDSNKSRSRIKLVDWSQLSGKLLKKTKPVKSGLLVKRAKSLIKNLVYMKYLQSNGRIEFIKDTYSDIKRYLKSFNLFDWYNNRLHLWINDWRKETQLKPAF